MSTRHMRAHIHIHKTKHTWVLSGPSTISIAKQPSIQMSDLDSYLRQISRATHSISESMTEIIFHPRPQIILAILSGQCSESVVKLPYTAVRVWIDRSVFRFTIAMYGS